MELKKFIRSIPDYPKKGILFRDITTLIKDEKAFEETINQITERSKLTAANQNNPIAYLTNRAASAVADPILIVKVSPIPDALNVNCVFLPQTPSWNFSTGTLGQYIYDAAGSKNFELDISEQTNLIINILKYAGVVIKDPEVVQLATQEAAKVEQNEKS